MGLKRAVALLIVAVTLAITPSPAAEMPGGVTVPPGMNPFCGIQYTMFDWDTKSDAAVIPANHMLATLYANGRSVSASVLLFSDSESFKATIPQLRLYGKRGSKSTPAFLIELPNPADIKYAYVESYSVDRAPTVRCNVMPGEIRSFANSGWLRPPRSVLSRLPTFAALSNGTLAPLRCHDAFEDGYVRHPEQPDSVPGLTKMITSKIAVFIAADGSVAKAAVASRSGSASADALARGAAMKSTYAPARFRCRPVAGQYIFTADFEPWSFL